MTFSEYRNQFPGVEEFRQAYGQLSFEQAKAMIAAEEASPSIKACMITTWREARRRTRLRNIGIHLQDSGELNIVFYEYDSDFDGNDFKYEYALDSNNAAAFLNMIPHSWTEPKTDIEEWLIENINCDGIGGDLKQKWVRMGLHGKYIVVEDYPGGIHREEKF